MQLRNQSGPFQLRQSAPAVLPGEFRPGVVAPVAPTAGSQQWQMVQGLLMAVAPGHCRICSREVIEQLIKAMPELVDGLQNVRAALHPAEVVGSGGAGHRELWIADLPQLCGLCLEAMEGIPCAIWRSIASS